MLDYPELDLIRTKDSVGKVRLFGEQLIEVPKVEIHDITGGPHLISFRSGGLFADRAFTLSYNYRWVIGREPLKESMLLLVPFRE